MKSALRSIPTILAATAAFGVLGTAVADGRDAQERAAALLSRPHAPESFLTGGSELREFSSAVTDAHAAAAALLSGQSTLDDETAVVLIVPTVVTQKPVDAHAHAAALLSRSTAPAGAKSPATAAIGDSLREHPAVLVAKRWSKRGIDVNEFIVAHPAGLQVVRISPTLDD